MRTMSGLDGAFLHIETEDTPMHVGALYLLERPAGQRGSYFEAVKQRLGPRLAQSAFFRARLAEMPLQFANPVWIEDQAPNMAYHLRQVLLPKPGSMQQLQDKVGELHSTLLDRDHPLWEVTVIDGLASGQVGLYFKVHHAALDGASGVALAKTLFDSDANGSDTSPLEPLPAPAARQGMFELVSAAFKQTAEQYGKLARSLPDVMNLVTGMLSPSAANVDHIKGKLGQNFAFGPKTPINVPISGQRSFACTSLPLAQIRQIAARHGAKLNDVVLAICSGALRSYLQQKHKLPRKSLIATVPVSLREPGNTATTTQATLTLVSLASHISDPQKRLHAICKAAGAAKSLTQNAKTVIPTDFPSLGVPWLLGGLASLYGYSKLASVMPPIANVAISNVPGPQQPLYVAGAKICGYWPLSIVEHGLGLNITLVSYCGSLDFGLTAASNAVPDVYLLAQMLNQSYEELLQLPTETPDAPAANTASNDAGAKPAVKRKRRQTTTTPTSS